MTSFAEDRFQIALDEYRVTREAQTAKQLASGRIDAGTRGSVTGGAHLHVSLPHRVSPGRGSLTQIPACHSQPCKRRLQTAPHRSGDCSTIPTPKPRRLTADTASD